MAALVTLTIPWATLQGHSDTPGEADGFGLLDGDDARDLAAAAARHPGTRWCITALHPDGTAAAHGCLPGRHPRPAPHPQPPEPHHDSVARGPCDHAQAGGWQLEQPEPGLLVWRTPAGRSHATTPACYPE